MKLGYTALMFAEDKECSEICVMLKDALEREAEKKAFSRRRGSKVK